MPRITRFAAILQATLLVAAIAIPATAAASSPTATTLTMLDASCSGAPGTITAGATVCARAVVTVSATGTGDYRTSWFGPGALTPTFQDVHALSGSGTFTFEDAHQLATAGVWTVRACKNAACVASTAIMATRAFNVAGAPVAAPTTLTVAPASATYGGTTSLSATLTTTGGGAPVNGATVTFALSGAGAGSAVTDAAGIATVTGVSLGATGAGSYPAAASASFSGTGTHGASSGSADLGVSPALSTTTVDCPATVAFTGDALEPCSASVTGAGGLAAAVTVGYADNLDAGTATATAAYGGDANHDPSGGSATFAITSASSTVSLSCTAIVTFTGDALQPCTANVTGVGGLDQSVVVDYTNNVDTGTAGATAAYAGDGNHDPSGATGSFEIAAAPSTVSLSCPAEVTYTGWAQTPCTATVTGAGGLNEPVDVTYADNVAGTATASASYPGDPNHEPGSATSSFRIALPWAGFQAPLTSPGHANGFKAGQTIPVKFLVRDAFGQVVRLSGGPTFSRSANLGSCGGPIPAGVAPAATPDAGTPFGWTGGLYHHNWSTKGLSAGAYRIFVNLADGSRQSVDVCLAR